MVKYLNKKAEIMHECFIFIKKEIDSFYYVRRKQKFLKLLQKKYPVSMNTLMKYFSEARKTMEDHYKEMILNKKIKNNNENNE